MSVDANFLDYVKRHLNITWEDSDTNLRVEEKIEDAVITLNHILGAEIDYSVPGMERNLFRDYMLYSWNDCLEDFKPAHLKEILQLQRKHRVEGLKNEAEQE